MGFLAPAWLFGLAAVAVPIAIHLLSRKEARRIRVGSIARLEAAVPKHVRRLALTDLPLLALRVAVIALLALVLAEPVWHRPAPEGGRVVAVAPEALASPFAGRLVDSLVADGYERRALSDSDYWSELDALDRTLGPSSRLAVVAPTRLSRLRGARPALHAQVEWFDIGEISPRQWVADARRVGTDSVRVIEARSDAVRTTFTRAVSIGDSGATAPDGVIVILHDSARTADARYAEAATLAALEYAGLEMELIARALPAPAVAPHARLIFWLSADDLPADLMAQAERGTVVFRDAVTDEWVLVERRIYGVGLRGASPRPVVVRRAATAPAGTAVWRDGGGTAVLVVERAGEGMIFSFASRLHPDWTDLVQAVPFPETIVGLLTGAARWVAGDDAYRVAPEDARRAGVDQAVPAERAGDEGTGRPTSVALPVWLLLVAVFGVERAVAATRRVAP